MRDTVELLQTEPEYKTENLSEEKKRELEEYISLIQKLGYAHFDD